MKKIEFTAADPTLLDPSEEAQKMAFYKAADLEHQASKLKAEKWRRDPVSKQIDSGELVGPVKLRNLSLEEKDTWEASAQGNFVLNTGDLSEKNTTSSKIELFQEGNETITKIKKGKVLHIGRETIHLHLKGFTHNHHSYYIKKEPYSSNNIFSTRLKNADTPTWPKTILPTINLSELPHEADFIKEKDIAFQECFRLACHPNELIGIKGPPGTGKTTLLAHAVSYLTTLNKKILIVSTSNAAIETAMEKTKELWDKMGINLDKKMVKKVSKGEHIPHHLKKMGVFELESSDIIKYNIFESYSVIGITLHSLIANPISTQADYIFFDEAGQSPAFQIACCAGLGVNFVLLGDESQLAPVLTADHPGVLDSEKSGIGFVQTKFPERIKPLLVNHRSNTEIVKYTQNAYYPDLDLYAETNREATLVGTPPTILINDQKITLPLRGIHFIPIKHSNRKKHSPEEVTTTLSIINKLLKLDKFIEGKQSPMTLNDIAILAPHRIQAQQLSFEAKELEEETGETLLCGTVHKLQGKGKAAVIYSMTVSNLHFLETTSNFLFDEHLWNVATSRSMALLYILGDETSLDLIEPKTLEGITQKEKIKERLSKIRISY